METNTQPTSPNLVFKRQEEQDLRIYFFIASREKRSPVSIFIPPVVEQKVIYVLDFKLEDAFEKAKRQAGGFSLLYTRQCPMVKEFLSQLGVEASALQFPSVVKKKDKPMDFESFKAGLLFMANEKGVTYEKPRDKDTLQKIIKGLEYGKERTKR